MRTIPHEADNIGALPNGVAMVEALGDAVDASRTRHNERVGIFRSEPRRVREVGGVLLRREVLDGVVSAENFDRVLISVRGYDSPRNVIPKHFVQRVFNRRIFEVDGR